MAIKLNKEDDSVGLRFEITNIVREEIGLNEHFASEIANAIVCGIRKRFCGQEIYVPKTDSVDIKTRNEAIRREFTGTAQSLDSIKKKYHVSKTTVYRICRTPKK